MYNFAIIDDDSNDIAYINDYINRAMKDFNFETKISTFSNGFDFLEAKNKNIFDLIFLDIDMPGMKGIEMAKKFREVNNDCIIIFVTRMAQYALEGYSVNAFDFIVKPISYETFSVKIPRFLNAIKHNQHQQNILINSNSNYVKVSLDDIYYIEVIRNDLIYFTKNGEIKERKTISKVEEELSKYGFARSSNSYLVNLKYVEKVTSTIVIVHGIELSLSRTFKLSFNEAFNNYLGEGGI